MSYFRSGAGRHVGGLFAFVLAGLFAVLALTVAVVGVSAYRSVLDTAERNHQLRASMAYIANKLRAADCRDQVEIGQFGGAAELTLGDRRGEYLVKIYLYQGALHEQWVAAGDQDFDRENGEYLVDAQAFTAQLDGGLVDFMVMCPSGRVHTASVALRSTAGGPMP